MGKVVNIGGPAEAIGDTFLVEVQGRKDETLDPGEEETEDPIQVKKCNDKKIKEEKIEDHYGTVKLSWQIRSIQFTSTLIKI